MHRADDNQGHDAAGAWPDRAAGPCEHPEDIAEAWGAPEAPLLSATAAASPCPFCGAESTATAMHCGDKFGAVYCESCGARGPDVRTGYNARANAPWRTNAVRAWNHRARGS
jgi:predicted RNA-binding Zn-ribbon protein involved in translation (DUF1610 family)